MCICNNRGFAPGYHQNPYQNQNHTKPILDAQSKLECADVPEKDIYKWHCKCRLLRRQLLLSRTIPHLNRQFLKRRSRKKERVCPSASAFYCWRQQLVLQKLSEYKIKWRMAEHFHEDVWEAQILPAQEDTTWKHKQINAGFFLQHRNVFGFYIQDFYVLSFIKNGIQFDSKCELTPGTPNQPISFQHQNITFLSFESW